MATTITGKLNKAASEFQAGGYTGFGIRLGKQYYDRESKSKQWTNYECAVFSNNTQQIEFYRSSLIEGAVVEVSAEAEKVKQFQGSNGLVLSIELLDCKIGFIHTPQGQQAPQQYAQPQQAPQQYLPQQAPHQPQQPQQAPQGNSYAQAQGGMQRPQPMNQFDQSDNVPF